MLKEHGDNYIQILREKFLDKDLDKYDTSQLIKLLTWSSTWELWKRTVTTTTRSYLFEISNARNAWAHQHPLSNLQTFHYLYCILQCCIQFKAIPQQILLVEKCVKESILLLANEVLSDTSLLPSIHLLRLSNLANLSNLSNQANLTHLSHLSNLSNLQQAQNTQHSFKEENFGEDTEMN